MAKTILLAANDPNITYLLQRYAEASGFETVRSSQSHAALEMARQAQPALIILEMEMPDAHGWHVLCSLKAEPQTQDIPVVVYSFMDDSTHHPQPDVAGYLKTPVLYDDFLMMLKDVGVQP
jgi:CheY-like chemotaxis protein